MSRLTSSFTCQLISVIITTLIIHHSFTLFHSWALAQNLPFQQILPTLIVLLPGLPSRSQDRTGLIMLLDLFLVRFFLFVPCDGLSWFHVSFLLHVKYTVSYRIGPFGGQNHRQTHICHDPQQYPLAGCKRVMSIAHFSGL